MRTVGLGLAVVVLCVCPAVAGAQITEGRTRLGLQSTFFNYESVTASADDADAEVDVSRTTYGLIPSQVGLDIARGVGEVAVLGAQLTFGGENTTVSFAGEEQDGPGNGSAVRLAAYVEAALSPGESVRPTIGAMLGYFGSSNGGQLVGSETHGVQVGVTAGLHGFLADRVSLDPQFTLLYQSGSAVGIDVGDISISGVFVGFSLGISGWLGGDEPQRPEREEPEEVVMWTPPRRPTGRSAQAVAPDLLVTSTEIDGIKVYWLGRPKIDPNAVGLRLQHRAAKAELAECRELTLVTDDMRVTYPLRYKATNASGWLVVEDVQITLDLAALENLNAAHKVAIELCGRTRTLDIHTREAAQRFAAQFKAVVASQPAPQPAPNGIAPALGGGASSAPTVEAPNGASGEATAPAPVSPASPSTQVPAAPATQAPPPAATRPAAPAAPAPAPEQPK